MPGSEWIEGRRACPALVLAPAFALAFWGCSSSSGGGGFGGAGGVGGEGGAATSMLRVAHLAFGVPEVDDTRLDFTVVDQGSFNGIAFGRASQAATLASGTYRVDVTAPGGGSPIASTSVELEADVQYTVTTYRDSSEASRTGLIVFDERTDDLEVDRGRVLIGHGADDSTWAMVDAVDVDAAELLVPDLALGDQSDPVDLAAGEHQLGFSISSVPPAVDEGPFVVEVDSGVAAVLVVVDRDVVDASVDAAVYVLEPDTSGMIPAIPLE